jgi:DNA mismatch repair ATPase MutL
MVLLQRGRAGEPVAAAQHLYLAQVEDGMLLIDQHRRHERVIYGPHSSHCRRAPALCNKLLFPLVI